MAWGMKNVVISIFGSSIMEGRIGADKASERWYNVLHAMLSERFPETCFAIINAAVGGESTRECMARFDRDVLAYNPDYCLFMIGGNNHDCERPGRILAEGELEALMGDFAARLPGKTAPIGVILNPCVNEWHFATKHPAFREYLGRFGGLDQALEIERDKFRKFIRARGWPSLDLYKLFESEPGRYILREDGIHLSKAGHRLFGEKMFELLESRLSGS